MSFNPRPRVLYVDNDEDSRDMLRTLLRFSRIETKAVGTATEALSLIQAERFDLYLLEAWLPGLDGFELCRRMRAFDPFTPILFFSAAAYEADKKRGIKAGANAYVIKPDLAGLIGSIRQFVSQAGSAAAQVVPAEREVSNPPTVHL
jgi:two-component system, OmpR family, response regulator